MIFNETVLKKLMKETYKGSGLLAGNKEGRIILAGGWWAVGVDESVFTNKAKAALVELIGTIPEQGELFRCTSGGNQHEMPGMASLLLEAAEEIDYSHLLKKTDVLLEVSGVMTRLYQSQNVTVAVKDIMDRLLRGDPEEYEDTDIKGPSLKQGNDGFLFWKTRECTLAAGKMQMISEDSKKKGIYTEQEELFLNLSSLKL